MTKGAFLSFNYFRDFEKCSVGVWSIFQRNVMWQGFAQAFVNIFAAGISEALTALLRLINAVTIVAEVGDFSRFGNPRQLMAYLGLAPSGHSSGSAVRRGDHESRQFLRATRADRGSLDLPHAGTR